MSSRGDSFWPAILGVLMVLMLITPVAAQTPAGAGIVVQQEVTTDAAGNRVVTERTFRNGILVEVEIKTFSPEGRLLRKVEETFANGRLLERETVIFNGQGQVISKAEVTFGADGRIVKVEEKTVTFQNGVRVETEREFRLINGVLTEVGREVERIEVINGQRVRIKQEFELRNGVLVLVEEKREVLSANQGPGNGGRDDDDDGDGDDDRDDEDSDDDRSGSNSGSH